MRSTTAFLSLAALAIAVPVHAQQRSERAQTERRVAPRAIQIDRQPRAVLGIGTSGSGAQDTLGVLVASVTPDSPAAAAGIKEGDRLLAVDGVNLRVSAADATDPVLGNLGARRLTRELGKKAPGDEVELRVQSGNQVRTVRAKLVDGASLARTRAVTRASGVGELRRTMQNRATLGIQVGSSGSRRDTLGVFIMSADDEGPAARAGIVEGMRIAAVNGTDLRVPVSDAADALVARSRVQRLTRALAEVEPGAEVELRVWQNGQYRNVRVRTVPSDSLRRNRGTFIIGDGMGIEGMGPLMRSFDIQGMPAELPMRLRAWAETLPARVPFERVEIAPSRRYH